MAASQPVYNGHQRAAARGHRRFDLGSWTVLVGAVGYLVGSVVYILLAYAQPSDGWRYSTETNTITAENQARRPSPLLPGDRVLAIGGTAVEGIDQVVLQPLPRPPGWVVGGAAHYTVARDGQTLELRVPLTTRPPVALLHYLWQDGASSIVSALTLLLAFGVFLVRPHDTAARLLLTILLFFVSTSIFEAEENPGLRFYPAVLFGYRVITAYFWPLMFAMLLHLVLIFPLRKSPLARYPTATLAAIYGLPVVAFVGLFSNRLSVYVGVILGLLVALIFALIATTVHNLRTARNPVVRAQIRWVALGLGTSFGGLALSAFLSLVLPPGATPVLAVVNWIWEQILSLALPICLAVAITRYRLFDIDVIIRRTLVYSLLSAALALIYIGGVVVLQRLLAPLVGESNQVAVVASTLAIVALFQPLRRRIQAAIDRRFYRRKYDAARTLQAFSARIRDQVDMSTLTDDMLDVVQDTLQPAHVSLWLRPSRRQ